MGLYILETEVSFELHCRLGHPSLFVEEVISSVF